MSLIIGLFAVSNIKASYRVEEFAKAEDGTELMDTIINVPPWNASEESPPRGWIGFNAILPHNESAGYAVDGVMIPADGDSNPDMIMRAVNETGLEMLRYESFDPYTWDSVTVYAAAILDASRLYDNFRFVGIDNSSKYILLFRCLKNETQDRPILVSLKETWLEEGALLGPLGYNVFLGTSIIVGTVGAILLVMKPKTPNKRPIKRLK
jgi:hypothetical protein